MCGYKLPACPSVILPYYTPTPPPPQLGYISVATHSGVAKEVSWGKKYPLK